MANHVSHASLPYIVKGCRYTVLVPYLDADGDPTDPTTPDTEISKDAGAFADTTEEVSTITGSNGMGYITLTGDETNCTLVGVAAKVASGPKNTLLRGSTMVFPSLRTGTAQAGAAGTVTLDSSASAVDDYYNGCIVKTTGGTGGGGGSGSQGNQARRITDYVGSTKVATIEPNWETTPDSTTTFAVLVTEQAVNVIRSDALQPTTAGRTLDVSSSGEAGVDWANVGSPTTTLNLSGTTISTGQQIASVSGAVGSVTGNVGGNVTGNVGGNVTGTVGSLATQAKADVNAEVLDVMNTDTFAEPTQEAPGATVSLVKKIGYLYKAWRNKSTQTATDYKLYADDTTTVDQKATCSDDATTFTRGEIATGP